MQFLLTLIEQYGLWLVFANVLALLTEGMTLREAAQRHLNNYSPRRRVLASVMSLRCLDDEARPEVISEGSEIVQ